jgi:hypothetical protein
VNDPSKRSKCPGPKLLAWMPAAAARTDLVSCYRLITGKGGPWGKKVVGSSSS